MEALKRSLVSVAAIIFLVSTTTALICFESNPETPEEILIVNKSEWMYCASVFNRVTNRLSYTGYAEKEDMTDAYDLIFNGGNGYAPTEVCIEEVYEIPPFAAKDAFRRCVCNKDYCNSPSMGTNALQK